MTPSTCHRAANVVIPTTCHRAANVVIPTTCHRAANVVIPTTYHGAANVVVPATCHGSANVVIPANAGIHRAGETRLDPGVRRGDGAWKRSVLRAQRSVRREIARGAVGALK